MDPFHYRMQREVCVVLQTIQGAEDLWRRGFFHNVGPATEKQAFFSKSWLEERIGCSADFRALGGLYG
ncbi:hypothetical protein ILYODFUR_021214 [Ilyodon furcidens]|uniref:Uncharacterized protein n=1 Tax=Ilyodon furcidens TaxID=33524 RepID=A0ABV0SYX9_9TELE